MVRAATAICRGLGEAGHLAWFAGGCVRDALLDQEPKDIDIATDAGPAAVLERFPGSVAVGAHFGVVLVRSGEFSFDVATFREDGSYSDGRRPDAVRYSSPEVDARRRDFTLNAMFWDPQARALRDFVGGRADLDSRLLRAVGDARRRFGEDSLRLLRAVRFAARYGLEIETSTWAALRDCAGEVGRVAPERIIAELERMWQHPSRVRAFDLLDEGGLLRVILPELEAMKGVEQPAQWHPEGDVFAHTRLVLAQLPDNAPVELVWAALLHDVGKPGTAAWDAGQRRWRFNGHADLGASMSREILGRLRAGNRLQEEVECMVQHHMDFQHVRQMRASTLRRMMGRPTFQRELELHRADCLGSNGFTDNHEFLLAKAEEFLDEPVVPRPLLNGDEVMELTGLKPGPALGRLLRELHDRQLEGDLGSPEEARQWVSGKESRIED